MKRGTSLRIKTCRVLAILLLLGITIPAYGLDLELADPYIPGSQSYLDQFQMIDLDHILITGSGNTCASAILVTLTYDSKGRYFANLPANIDQAGDVDWYVVELPTTGCNMVSAGTTGSTDTLGELYWGCGTTAIGSDDNSGTGNNFAMTTLGGGKLYIKVRHAKPNGTGAYTLKVVNQLLR